MKKLSLFVLALVAAGTANAESSSRKFAPPVMGWSSWNTYMVDINDSLIMKQADAMVAKGLKDAGYTNVNIDDGFFGQRDAEGRMQTHPERFPNGLKGVADYIHSLGLKAGIYSEAGNNTCGSMYNADENGVGAGLYGHERIDADRYFNDWGFDFIKIDYCGAEQLGLEEERRYREIRKAIDETTDKNISINVCRWAYPGTWVKDVGLSWRISADIRPEWKSIKYIIDKNKYLSAYAGNGHYNDMDMLEIGRGLPPEEEEVHFGMWCIMSSPLLIGCDMTTIPESSLKLLKNKELIALNQDPLGLQAYVVHNENGGSVFVKDIETERGRVRAAALYNPGDTVCDFTVPLTAFELGGKVKMRDLVHHKDLKPAVSELKMQLPPHSVKILRLEGEKRLEPSLYEAEWAYLPLFNDLGRNPRGIAYVPMKEASGGMKVTHLGGSAENHAEWSKVYSETGGRYELTVTYIPQADRRLEIMVNGRKAALLTDLAPKDKQPLATVTVPVELRKGYNTVSMGSTYCWAPDIDCFTLKKVN